MNDLEHKDDEKYPAIYVFGFFLLIINFIYSTINIFLSTNYLPREELNFDYLGLLVGIMSIIVTVLVGWQIFNILSFEKTARKIVNKAKGDLNKKIEEESQETSNNIKETMEASIAASLYHLSCAEYNQDNILLALQLSLDSMLHCNRVKNMQEDFQKDVYKGLTNTLELILDQVYENNKFTNEKIGQYVKSAWDLRLNKIAEGILLKCKPGDESDCTSYIISKGKTYEYHQFDIPFKTNNLDSGPSTIDKIKI